MDVTVITPTILGRESLLQECKDSVINQIEPVKSHLYLLDKDLRGPGFIRNELAKQADTEWIAFLDDDDILLPEHFAIHKCFEDEADVIFSWSYVILKDGTKSEFKSSFDPKKILSGYNTIPMVVTIRKEIFDKVGGFDIEAKLEDLKLWQTLIAAQTRFYCINRITWHYRLTPNSRNMGYQ